MFERRQSGEVPTTECRRREHVAVEVELKTVGGDAVRHGGQTSPRAVDDATRRVAKARLRTGQRRRRGGRLAAGVAGRSLRRSTNERLSHRLNPQQADHGRRHRRRSRPHTSSRGSADVRRHIVDGGADGEHWRHSRQSLASHGFSSNVASGYSLSRGGTASQTASDVDEGQLVTAEPHREERGVDHWLRAAGVNNQNVAYSKVEHGHCLLFTTDFTSHTRSVVYRPQTSASHGFIAQHRVVPLSSK